MNVFWTYIKVAPGLWSVGFYDALNTWHSESVWLTDIEAMDRAKYLNGM